MASSVIHLCIAKEVNKYLQRTNKDILIGSIAPDISKHLNQTKVVSHFLDNEKDNIPNLNRFLEKYQTHLTNDFVMGYYIHLYTDYIWFKYFIPKYVKKDFIYTLEGKISSFSDEEKLKYIYNDYTNLNIKLIDEYNLDLKIFYENILPSENIITEIPMDKIQIIIDATGLIIKNTQITKPYIFDLIEINNFIKSTTNLIINDLKKLNINCSIYPE